MFYRASYGDAFIHRRFGIGIQTRQVLGLRFFEISNFFSLKSSRHTSHRPPHSVHARTLLVRRRFVDARRLCDETTFVARDSRLKSTPHTAVAMFAIGGKKDQAKAAALAKTPKSAVKPGALGGVTASHYPTLSMYTNTPSADISLETFEAYALDRMRVLKAIDDGLSRGTKQPEMEFLMNEETGKYLKLSDTLPVGDTTHAFASDEVLSKDEVSHFALRLAYCRTEELRRWFLLNECTLFKHRFGKLDSFAKARFLEDHAMEYKPISADEFIAVKQGLAEVLSGMMKRDDRDKIMATGASGFYSVPFEEVHDLVRGRRVFMSNGQAFVPRDQLTSLVVGAFRAGLSKQLAVASRRWAQHIAGEEKERLAPVIVSLSKRYLGRWVLRFPNPGTMWRPDYG